MLDLDPYWSKPESKSDRRKSMMRTEELAKGFIVLSYLFSLFINSSCVPNRYCREIEKALILRNTEYHEEIEDQGPLGVSVSIKYSFHFISFFLIFSAWIS